VKNCGKNIIEKINPDTNSINESKMPVFMDSLPAANDLSFLVG
jgi:hypothetical protein